MYVQKYMTKNVVTVTRDMRVLEVLDLMKKNNVNKMPVVQGNRLIGLVTYRLISRQLPSQHTSLSMHEVNYLLTKTTVGDIMETAVETIAPTALLEAAAVVMRDRKIDVLPVVFNDELVGIITQSDIFDAFIDVLGYNRQGTRLVVELVHESGQLEKMAALFTQSGYNVEQIAVYHDNNKAQVVIQLDTSETTNAKTVLETNGFNVLSAIQK